MARKEKFTSTFPFPSQSKNQTATSMIDLHGYRKSEAIRTLTHFLDRVVAAQQKTRKVGDIWVLVITGSGAHSSEGPVLRSAVQTLLERRQMIFTINRGRGSFTVKANSGIVFIEPGAPRDTKVLLQDTPDPKPALPLPPKNHAFAPTLDGSDDSDDAPTPHEVSAFDRIIEESRKDHQAHHRELKKGERIMERALSMSRLEAEKEEKAEQELLERAVSLSLLDVSSHLLRDDDDEEELQNALELSKLDFLHSPDDNDDLHRALELSQQVSSKEDEEMLRILELSKNDFDRAGDVSLVS